MSDGVYLGRVTQKFSFVYADPTGGHGASGGGGSPHGLTPAPALGRSSVM